MFYTQPQAVAESTFFYELAFTVNESMFYLHAAGFVVLAKRAIFSISGYEVDKTLVIAFERSFTIRLCEFLYRKQVR